MKARNKVVSGDFKGRSVTLSLTSTPVIKGFFTKRKLNRKTVSNYELVKDEQLKSTGSAVSRGLVGGLIGGGLGMVAGAVTGKNKGIYVVAVQFNDGKRSLIELDSKIYTKFIEKCF